MQACLEDVALGRAVGGELLRSPAKLGFQRGQPLLDPGHELLAVALDARHRLRQPPLEALCRRFADVRELVGQQPLRLVCEGGHGSVELAGEPTRGVLARALDRVGELHGRGFRVLRRRTLDDPLEPFHEPPLDVREDRLDALHRIRLLAFDPLPQLALAPAEPLVELVQRTAPFDGMAFQIGLRDGDRLLGRSLELLAQLDQRLALRLAVRRQPLGVGREAALRVLDLALLSQREPAELLREVSLCPREILPPFAEALLDAPLCVRERFRKVRSRNAFPLCERVPPLVGDPPFLLREQRQGVGPSARQQVFELARVRRRLLFDHPSQPRLCALGFRVEAPRPPSRVGKKQRADSQQRADRCPGSGDGDFPNRIRDERDPGADCHNREDAGERAKRPRADPLERGRHERRGGQDDSRCEGDLHGGLHRGIVGHARSYASRVGLEDDVRHAAERAAAHAVDGERVDAVLAAEPSPGRRFYLCAYVGGPRTWLVLDHEGAPVADKTLIRDVVSIAALCEVAADAAGGGDLQELRSRLASVRLTENPPGIDDAEEAALELERAVGAPPRLATPTYLDSVGAATRRLERTLGEDESPFGRAVASAFGAVEALTDAVESGYKKELA